MEDRYDRTRRAARAAIERAQARQSAARRRRDELELRIAELDEALPQHRLESGLGKLAEARARVTQASASSELARRRAAEADARRAPR